MAKKKLKIMGANENVCPMCDGIVYKLMTSIGLLCQCKKCGCTYQINSTGSDIDDNTRIYY